VLKPLGQALSRWTPVRRGRIDDPVSALAAAWPEIVGADIARNSQPIRIDRGTLWIVTASGAWGQQLTFLTDRLLAAIRERTPQTIVERLRFRVGKIAAVRRAPKGRHELAPRAVEPPRPVPESAADALASFRRHVEGWERAKRAAGWKECRDCKALLAPGSAVRCAACANAAIRRRTERAARLLADAPWLGYSGTAELVDELSASEYEALRAQLLTDWRQTLDRSRAVSPERPLPHERGVASAYVLLATRLRPNEIDPGIMRGVLGDAAYDRLYELERTEPNGE
jgi:Dna[CI] antecedent, DciA